MNSRILPRIARLHGWYYIVSGLWPLLHPASFQALTGYKVDYWLAQVVGVLLAVSGAAMLVAARAGRFHAEIVVLACGEALVLGFTDIICVSWPGTTRAYWADAAVEGAFVVVWLWGWWNRTSVRKSKSLGS